MPTRTLYGMGAGAALVLAIIAVAALLVARSGPEVPIGSGVERLTETPRCADVERALRRTGRHTCRSAGTLLVIAGPGIPAVMPEVEARASRSVLAEGVVRVRVRVRNRTAGRQAVHARQRQFSLSPASPRVYAQRLARPTVLRPGEAATIDLRFRLTSAQAAQLRSGDRRVDLRILPFTELGARQPRRLAVIRLPLRIA